MVSVGLKVGVNLVKFQFDHPYDAFIYKGDQREKIDRVSGSVSISQNDSQMILVSQEGKVYFSDTIVFRPIQKSTVYKFKSLSYSGDLRVFVHKPAVKTGTVKRWKGNLVVVNQLKIEEYLRGVVPSEMPSGRIEILEALKVQAISARTYTYAHLGYNSSLGFDVYDDVRDQVYLGRKVYPASDEAIRQTQHTILVDQNKRIAVTLYHAVCGGETTNIEEVWGTGRKKYPYLRGRKDRIIRGKDLCRGSTYYTWQVKWTKKQLAKILQKSLARWIKNEYKPFKFLKEIRILNRNSSGRVTKIKIVTDNKTYKISGDRIRWVLRQANGKSLNSILFRLSYNKGIYTVNGKGFGHGVGMCQVGAMQQAREKRSYRKILNHYYSGTQLIKVKSEHLR